MTSFKSGVDKVVARFYAKTSDGNSVKLRIMVLPDERHEDFIDLFMKYFVAQEETHTATGILESSEAMNEFRKSISKYFKNDFIQILICCLDSDETASNIYGASVLKLHRKGYRYDDSDEVQTEPVRKCKKMDKILECLISAADIMTRYNIDRYYELLYAVVRSEMRQMGILTELTKASSKMCLMQGVPLMGTWCTSVGSQKVAQNRGSDLIYEINYKDLGQLSDLSFKDDSHTIKFMAQRTCKSSKL